MKKILVILSSISKANGVSAYALNYLKELNKEEFCMDFVVVKPSDIEVQKQFEEQGAKVYRLIREKENYISYIRKIKSFMKENVSNYDIVHSHVYNFGAIILRYAKKYGVNYRILHSHATVSSDKCLHRLINSFLIPIAKFYSTHYFACSKLAGNFLFKNKDFTIINNAVDVNKFSFDEKKRIEIRKNMGIDNAIVIGNVGRLCEQKNQMFLLKVFEKIYEENKLARLIIIGNGNLEEKIKKVINEKNLQDVVYMFGAREDVFELYNCMDVFVLTSLYEGLPIVGIEAQCNGVPCVFSDAITNEVKVKENVKFLSLNQELKKWKQEIINSANEQRVIGNEKLCKYRIENAIVELEEKYKKICEERR